MLPSDKGDNPTRRVKTLKGRRRQGLLRTETMPRDRDHYGQAFLLILSAAIPKHQGGGSPTALIIPVPSGLEQQMFSGCTNPPLSRALLSLV